MRARPVSQFTVHAAIRVTILISAVITFGTHETCFQNLNHLFFCHFIYLHSSKYHTIKPTSHNTNSTKKHKAIPFRSIIA